jgi:hypothetical protein
MEIHVKGKIDPEMTDWFQGISIQPISAEESCLCWQAADNSAIYGILSVLGSLGLSLISVTVIENDGIGFAPSSTNQE